MTPKVKRIYESALKNKQFLEDIYNADGDTKPSMFSESLEKHLFVMCYYGWLVAKYGKDWELHL